MILKKVVKGVGYGNVYAVSKAPSTFKYLTDLENQFKAEMIYQIFKPDTGFYVTCFNVGDFKIQEEEHDFRNIHKELELIGTSIDKTSQIVYYPMQVETFVAAGLDLGSVSIYITFDPRAHKRLLGMDILRLMNIELQFGDKELVLTKIMQFTQFRKNKLKLEISETFKLGIYSKNDYKNSIDWQNMLER